MPQQQAMVFAVSLSPSLNVCDALWDVRALAKGDGMIGEFFLNGGASALQVLLTAHLTRRPLQIRAFLKMFGKLG